MNSAEQSFSVLVFPLEVNDGWPPVAAESLPFQETPSGYVATVPPLFVKNISVGDLIEAKVEPGSGRVLSWRHIRQSGRTTIWLLRLRQCNTIETALAQLRLLGCNTTGIANMGIYSIDVPDTMPMAAVDSVLAQLDETFVATAFPAMRHPE